MNTTTFETTTVNGWKRYPEYRPSSFEWIGDIPCHWDCARTRYIARLESGHTPSRQEPEYWKNCNIPWFTLADVWQLRGGAKYVNDTEETISELGLANSAARLLPAGTVILSRTASVGFAGILRREMATSQDFVNWVCGPRLVPEFLWYVFQGMRPELQRLMMGSTHKTIYMPQVQSFSTPIPPLSEQRAIAEFLDRETARIDALIEQKEQLIKLLEEKRQAVISQAVTRGLDPNVPTKDSGVPALGTVPAHWEVRRNKLLFREIDQRSLAGQEDLLTVSHITGVTPRSEKPDVTMFLAESNEDYKVCEPGDLVVNTMWAFMGALGVSPQEGCVSPSYNVYRLRDSSSFHPAFLDLLYRTDAYKCEMFRFSKGIWHSRLRLYPEAFMNLLTVKPPRTEQEQILRYIESQTTAGRALFATLQKSIAQLQEYRTAMISAAVTGQIDVRGEVPL